MQNSPILEKILADTYTLSDLHKRIRTLKTYLLKILFQSSEQIDEPLQSERNWLHSLGDEFYKQFNQQNIYPILEELEKELKNINILVMYLPIDPNKSQIDQIGAFLRKNYGDKFILDMKYDPQLIGGCALVWNGIYKDYSLRASIQNNSQKILESFQQVFNKHN
jgi:hypothetical protein